MLNFTFDILETNSRVGGRVYIHEFSNQRHDYHDIGAMRCPFIPITPAYLRTCVYPSHNLHDGADKPAVLLASYSGDRAITLLANTNHEAQTMRIPSTKPMNQLIE